MKNRRECQVYSKSDFLNAFETANSKIIAKFKQSSNNICSEGIKHLQEITFAYLMQQPSQQAPFPTFQEQRGGFTFENPVSVSKKPIIEDVDEGAGMQHRELTFHEKEEVDPNENIHQSFGQSERKVQVVHSQRKRETSAEKLKRSFKKMGLDDRFYLENEEGSDNENEELVNKGSLLDDNPQKTLAELIYESNRKVEEKIAQRANEQRTESSDSSYPLTDYSSNESSNDNEYQEDFKSDTKRMGSKSSNSQSLSQSYQPTKILHSPKKSKSQSKRLYIRDKKIPKWAEDLQKVNETVELQKQSPDMNPDSIYGLCVVEKLDTNLIFRSTGEVHRGSSAKWSRNPYNQFIT